MSAMLTLGVDRTTINKLLYDLHAHATQTHDTVIKLLPDLLQNAPVHCDLEQMPVDKSEPYCNANSKPT